MDENDKKALELKQMLDGYEREKQLITESYQKKVIALDEEARDIEKKIGNLEQILKDAFAARQDNFDRMVKDLESDRAAFVDEKNMYNYDRKKLEGDKSAFEKWADNETAEIDALRKSAESLANDSKSENQRIIENIAKEQSLLNEIESKKKEAQIAFDNLADKSERIENDKNYAAALKRKAEETLSTAESTNRKAEALMDSASEKMLDAQKEKEQADKSIAESRDFLKTIESKKLEVENLIAESDGKLRQLSAESEKNRNDAMVNRAKEITLNERERNLAERERSVKILQDKL